MRKRLSLFPIVGVVLLTIASDAFAQFPFATRPQDLILKSVLDPEDVSNPTAPRYGITRREVELIKEIVGSEKIIPVRTMPITTFQYSDRFIENDLLGTTHDFLLSENAEIVEGRFLLEKDIQNLNNVVVITSSDAKRLFGNRDALGKNVHIQDDYYLIVGVLDSQKKEAYIPISTMRSRFGDLHISRSAGAFRAETFEISEVRIPLQNRSNITDLIRSISNLLKPTHEYMDYSINTRRR